MLLESLAFIASLAFQKASDGPALPIAFLASSKPAKVSVGSRWYHGYLNVGFEYHIKQPKAQIVALCAKLPGQTSPITADMLKVGTFTRRFGGVIQSLSVRDGADGVGSSGAPKGDCTIQVGESVDPTGRLPEKWYRGAISPKPPAPLIDVPFLSGVKCEGVSFESFDELMSSKVRVRAYPGRDVTVYDAIVHRPVKSVFADLESWAKLNSYRKTGTGSYFRAGARLFEITALSYGEYSSITLWTTDRNALHPIPWVKN